MAGATVQPAGYGTKFTGGAGLAVPSIKRPMNNGIGMGQKDGSGSMQGTKTHGKGKK